MSEQNRVSFAHATKIEYSSTMPKVTFVQTDGQKKVVDGKAGDTVLKTAQDNQIPMESACGGNGFCTTCLCGIEKGAENLSPKNDREENMGIEEPQRLGCQAVVQGDVTVKLEA